MIQHILLFRFNENIPSEVIGEIMNKFVECKDKLPEFINFQHGTNVSSKKQLCKGFTYGVIMTFENNEAITKYNNLEEHKEAQKLQEPYLEDVLVFDIQE